MTINYNSQNGKTKAYQVRQVLKAIERLEVESGVSLNRLASSKLSY